MNEWLATFAYILIGLAFGGGWALLDNRLTRVNGRGLKAEIQAKRRGEYLYAATWVIAAGVWALSFIEHGGWWRLAFAVCSVGMVAYFVNRIRIANRLLANPLFYLVAIRHEFGGES